MHPQVSFNSSEDRCHGIFVDLSLKKSPSGRFRVSRSQLEHRCKSFRSISPGFWKLLLWFFNALPLGGMVSMRSRNTVISSTVCLDEVNIKGRRDYLPSYLTTGYAYLIYRIDLNLYPKHTRQSDPSRKTPDINEPIPQPFTQATITSAILPITPPTPSTTRYQPFSPLT